MALLFKYSRFVSFVSNSFAKEFVQDFQSNKNFSYKDVYTSDRIEILFNELKSLIQNIEIRELSLNTEERSFVQGVVDKYQYQSDSLTVREESFDGFAIHSKTDLFLNKFFSVADVKEKALLAQRLFNAKYEFHQIYYCLPWFLLSKICPKITKFINFRDSEVQRILKPEGTRLMIDSWKSSGKLSSALQYVICDSVEDLEKELRELKNKEHDHCFFFLQMDASESLRGDHTVPIFITADQEVIITDTCGTAKSYLDVTARFICDHLSEAKVLGFSKPRQTDSNSCCMIAFNDASYIGNHLNEMIQYFRSQELRSVPDASYKLFDALPEEMMQITQTRSWLKNESSSDVFSRLTDKQLIVSGEDVDLVQHWAKKGVLIAEERLTAKTNILANKCFAHMERKILEICFSDDRS
ncbi:MAG: hypothetical protein V4494_04290 [Chlamydiota bacterium]